MSDEYLKTDYDLITSKYLKSAEDIESFFEEDGAEFFECGQGYSQEVAEVMCQAGDKFYSVTLRAEIESSKQDRGDRLYWVDEITSVVFREIDKPLPKPRHTKQLCLESVSDFELNSLCKFLESNSINYTVK